MFLHLLISLAMAAPASWLVKAPSANPHEFFVFAQNSADGKISQTLTACEQNGKITQLLKKAQFNFLNGSLDTARDEFSQISEMKWSCDWKEDERQIVVFSFFRLAQLSQVPSEQMNWLSEAIAFDDTVTPDVSVFPPPLVDLYRKTKEQMPRRQMLLPDSTKKFSSLLRNGKPVSLNALAFETYSMRARFTLVSDTYRPETVVLTPDEFQQYQIEPKALVDGTCDKFTVAEELKGISSYKVFFGPECVKEGVTTDSPAVAAAAAGLTPDLANQAPIGPRKKTWFERNLLWVGVAVVSSVAVAQMVKNNQGHDTYVRPNTTLTER